MKIWLTDVYKPYKYKKITNKEIAAKKFFLIFLNKSVIIGPILIQL